MSPQEQLEWMETPNTPMLGEVDEMQEEPKEKPECFKNFGLGKPGNAEKIINYIIWGDENRRDFTLEDRKKLNPNNF